VADEAAFLIYVASGGSGGLDTSKNLWRRDCWR